MDRHYCKNCGTIVIEGDDTRRSDDYVVYCPYCEDDNYKEVVMSLLPDYETPDQYEKRTGEKWNGALWVRIWLSFGSGNKWGIWFATSNRESYVIPTPPNYQVLCAQSPEPPPDDWIPEEEQH